MPSVYPGRETPLRSKGPAFEKQTTAGDFSKFQGHACFLPESRGEGCWGCSDGVKKHLCHPLLEDRCPVPESSGLTHSLPGDRRRPYMACKAQNVGTSPLPKVIEVLKNWGREETCGAAGRVSLGYRAASWKVVIRAGWASNATCSPGE